MSYKTFRAGLRLLPTVLGGIVLVFQPLRAEEACVSDSCHPKLLKAKAVHAATESCSDCHESTATPHPQKDKKTFKLTQSPPALCENCHDALGKKSQVHTPVKEGSCTTCHDAHASDQAKLLVQPLPGLCTLCHEDKWSPEYPHGPVSAGDCTACHAPHEADLKGLLVKPGDELCTGCHVDTRALLKKPFVHEAVSAGCTSCHNPHGGPHPKLLTEEGPQLCFGCHDSIGERVQKAAVAHAPIKDPKGCANCHSPHASDQAKLLLKPQKDVCLDCHTSVITKNMTTLHGPVRDGQCTPCHDPHGGAYANLLVRSFPSDPYAPYTEAEYALCFGCHKRDLLQYPDTSFATNFRDGDRNLHYVHVNNKQKGRSCKLCHSPHGGTSPVLIAESVPFGKWSLPLKFVKTDAGGKCSPGCHKPLSYERQGSGKKPDAEKLPKKP